MNSATRTSLLSELAEFERGMLDFDELMGRLAGILFEKGEVRVPMSEDLLAAWRALDDVHSIASSQSFSRPLKLELNHEVRAEFERFRRLVESLPMH